MSGITSVERQRYLLIKQIKAYSRYTGQEERRALFHISREVKAIRMQRLKERRERAAAHENADRAFWICVVFFTVLGACHLWSAL